MAFQLVGLVLACGCAAALGYVLAPSSQLQRRNRTTIDSLAKEVATVQAQLPVWTTEMEAIAAQCAEVLDQAERRRKRAAASESRRARDEQQGNAAEDAQDGELRLPASRAEALAMTRAARRH